MIAWYHRLLRLAAIEFEFKMDMYFTLAVLMMTVSLSVQHTCDSCDCIVSENEEAHAVQLVSLSCLDGKVTWYNPVGALRIELRPNLSGTFRSCFITESGKARIKVSQEKEIVVNSKSPSERSSYVMNDHNLQPLMSSTGSSSEVCLTSSEHLILYLEPEITEGLSYQKVVFYYDNSLEKNPQTQSIEDCRPCSEAELLQAYCSSDFVIVASMDNVEHDHLEKSRIGVVLSQIIRQSGSLFTRNRRDLSTLQGVITAPRKCGIVKGDGLFLMTGRVRLGELTLGCAPYFSDWENIVSKAELEGKMECGRD